MNFQREVVFERNVVGTVMQCYHIRKKKSKQSMKKKAKHCNSPTNEIDLAQQLVFLKRD